MKPLISSLFISKNADELPLLRQFCDEQHIAFHAQSLLKFEGVPFAVQHPFDVVFFSSIRAAEFILAQSKISHADIACVGQKTAQKLETLGHIPTFVGHQSGDPSQVALDFRAYVGQRRLLIPCSDISARTIAKALPADQVEEVVVYRTIAKSVDIPACDVYVFTSPSSIDAFLQQNEKPFGQIIAWGDTTAARLHELGIEVSRVLKTSSEEEVVEVLKGELKTV
jgi:uroporphyrinogen-III synthase